MLLIQQVCGYNTLSINFVADFPEVNSIETILQKSNQSNSCQINKVFPHTPINRKVNTPSKETVMKSAIFGLSFQAFKM